MNDSGGFDILSSGFIDEIPLIVVGFNAEGKVTKWNRNAERSTGYTRDEAESRGITSLLGVFTPEESSNPSLPEAISHLRRMLQKEFIIKGREMSFLSRHGEIKYVRWYSHVISGTKKGKGPELILTGVDMTDWHLLQNAIREREKYVRTATSRLKKCLFLDPQTDLLNYRHFMVEIQKEFSSCFKKSSPLALLMIDIDNFNSINSAYGIGAGNFILKEFSGILRRIMDKNFIPARFGGTKFAVLMPGTDIKTAHVKSSRINSTINEYDFGARSSNMRVFISTHMALGGYPHCEDVVTAGQLVARVLDRLEGSKKAGTAGVVICPPQTILKEVLPTDTHDDREYVHTVEFVNALAKAVKSKDFYTQEHSCVMSDYAVSVAEHMGMDKTSIRDVMFGSILHDVGKIGIDDSILLKPGPLSKSEYETIKQHPRIGAEIIRNVRPLKDVVPLVLYHHERYDGTGYLNRLKGKEIPLGARIISLADVFQALTSDRPYRKALTDKAALAIIEEYSGKYFDPEVVANFYEVYRTRSS